MYTADCLYIVAPAYNERDNIEEFIEQAYPMLDLASEYSRLLIINDGSKDDTADILNKLQDKYPKMIVLHEKNKGHGPTLWQAYSYAVEAGAGYIFQCDSDNQVSFDYFPELWLRRSMYSFLAGRRAVREDGKQRVFVSTVLSLLMTCSFGVRVKDVNVPFRLYTRDFLQEVLPFVDSSFAIPNALLLTMAYKLKLPCYRHNVVFKARAKGNNSLNFGKIIQLGLRSFSGVMSCRSKFLRQKRHLELKLQAVPKVSS